MVSEVRSFQDLIRAEKLAIKRDISRRVTAIVTEYHPDPVLLAAVNDRITSETPTLSSAEGRPLSSLVSIGHSGVVAFATQLAIERREVVFAKSLGDELKLRLPLTPEEAGHITVGDDYED